MKINYYVLPLLLTGSLFYSQDKITKKNGSTVDVKLIEIGSSNITYKELDNPDGPSHSMDKSEVYEIAYSNGKTEILGKYKTADEAKSLIIAKINEYGIDRDRNDLSLRSEFDGDNIKINSVNMKGRVVHEGDLWDLSKVIAFHEISKRKDNIAYLNIITYKITKSKRELSKLVIKMTDYEATAQILEAMKDLRIMLKKD
ncbi:hypothetical protein C1637_13400 [Chryseobacterium lactis]|uniref:Uncharacterized protein n=1 Tax=Chryseobacterium lactis TaxID=1241981 RepID=A0A3G6RK44_CHRLC|nr:hypothetical protein [Chryseobacterium lactis]AZA83878.1 hypothetical protein EG342_19165 [Chryseobacterium lactis]AZB04263.1 hypothetical protein EG341_10040 [Chryseobacterium lactis]PNW12829.1 hypothetical protein C1637_13400 [Chryseobacterium lactis]